MESYQGKLMSYKNILLLIILFSIPNFSQSVKEIKLDLNSAIEYAFQNNHDLKISKYNKDYADEQLREAWGSAVFPDIKGSVNYQRTLKKGVFIFEPPGSAPLEIPIGTDNSLSASVTLDQPLFTGALFIAVRVAKTYVEISSKSYDQNKSELVKDVKQIYYMLLLSKQVHELTKANLTLAESNYKNVKAMYDAGLVSDYDLVRSKVQVQNLIPEVQQSENSVTVAENMLKFITGIDYSTKLIIDDTLKFQMVELNSFDDYLSAMNSNNHLLQQLQLFVRLRDDVVTARFSDHLPSLYAFGNWQAQAQENDISNGGKSFDRWRYINAVTIGLNLKIPIFNGFQTSARIQQAEIDHKIAIENFQKTSRYFQQQLNELLLKTETTKEKIIAYKESIVEAELAYSIAQKRYSSGVGTQLELVDGMVGITRAKVNYYNGIYDYLVQQAMIDQLLGKF